MNYDKNQEYFGQIKWFNKKGFGVISVNDTDNEVFVHHSNVITDSKNFVLLEEGENVSFHLTEDKGKVCAVKVQPCEDNFNFEKKNLYQFQEKPRRKKNTESFKPSHLPADMRIIYCSGKNKKYSRNYHSNEVILVNDLFCEENDLDIYNKLSEEMKNCGVDEKDLWKLWHGDTHYIADDKKDWRKSCPTFNSIIETIKKFFNMDVQTTRFNLYKDSSQWKPFHHDAAALKQDKAQVQNITVGVSFGAERDVSFQHARKRTVVSTPLVNGSIYVFNKDVNVEWRHGIPQVPEERRNDEGRISIIVWGKVDMGEKV